MSIEIKVPAMGESVTEATVARWFKKEGDAVARDEPLLELETDKVTVEVPSPSAGAIEFISVADGCHRRGGHGTRRDRRRGGQFQACAGSTRKACTAACCSGTPGPAARTCTRPPRNRLR